MAEVDHGGEPTLQSTVSKGGPNQSSESRVGTGMYPALVPAIQKCEAMGGVSAVTSLGKPEYTANAPAACGLSGTSVFPIDPLVEILNFDRMRDRNVGHGYVNPV